MKPVAAGGAYFLVVFLCGFVLGAIRVLFVAPAVGAFGATLMELPVMLAISWWAANTLVASFKMADNVHDSLVMGGVAFGLLMAAETALGLALGRPLGEQWQALFQSPGLVGLFGQTVFGLMPMLIALQKRRASR